MNLSDLKGGYTVVSAAGASPTTPSAPSTAPTPPADPLKTAADITGSIFGGEKIGESLTDAVIGLKQLLTGDTEGFKRTAASAPHIPALIGDYIRAGSNLFGAGAALPKTLLSSAALFGGLGGAGALGEDLSNEKGAGETAADTAKSTVIGGAAGGLFNLLGKAASAIGSKVAPSALSFTSGVPKEAISQAAESPAVAKQGLGMTVREVRDQMLDAHKSLSSDLGSEFEQGLKTISSGPSAQGSTAGLATTLFNDARDTAEKFKVALKGAVPTFDKSAIVSPGEKSAVQETFSTLKNWDDFSAKGLQDLSARIGALRKFDSNGTTRSSAIIGQVYHQIGDAIREHYPDLATLRTNFATHKKVLDEIGNVIGAAANKPTQVQSAVTRLDNLFRENRDEYLNAVRQLSQKSGTDFLSLLAGGEFQKVLPGFIRGLGGGGAVGVGASVLNPWLMLLAPLFSPRAVGAIVRNGKAAQEGVGAVVKAAASPASQQLNR